MEAHLHVVLLSHTPEPEKTVSAAARLCYSKANIEDIAVRTAREDQSVFLKKLTESGHLSPIEHASFSFAIEGISRACSHQLVRHRLASYSQQSQRYVSPGNRFSYVIPPSIKEDDELRICFEKAMEEARKAYMKLNEILSVKGNNHEAAKEDARFVLPNAMETRIIMTMNARELLHFFSQRLCNRAQWEIRALALSMLKLVVPVAPSLFRKAGPHCINGKCPEGTHTCGKSHEVRQFFQEEIRKLSVCDRPVL